MQKIKTKTTSLLIITCLVLQLMVSIIAFAADMPDNLTGETDYLVVHNTIDSYDELGGPSSIIVESPDGNEILPDENEYSDVPAGATIKISYVFHLENDDGEGELYTYSGDNYFDIALPIGITFVQPDSAQEIIATDSSDSGNPVDWTLGSWYFTDDNTIRVELSDEVADHSNMWGKIYIDGVFNALGVGDDDTTKLILGSEEVIFTREVPAPPEIEVEKEGIYEPSANEITWTINVTPPENTDLDGYSLVDTFSSNQAYVPGSFSSQDINIDDSELDLSENNKVIYVFPEGTLGEQTITYKTSPTSFSSETGNSTSTEYTTFTNTAYVNAGDETITDPVDAEVTVDWISKSGSTATSINGVEAIKWTVNVSVPNDGVITGAAIKDTIPAGLILMDEDNYRMTISINGASEEIVSGGVGAGTYSYNFIDNDNTSALTYYFPSSESVGGQLGGEATLTYYTKVIERDQYLNNNSTISFTNDAEFTWNEMPDAVNPPGDKAGVNVKGSGGLISKSAGSTQNYSYPGYIHWTITANSNKISMEDVTITDNADEGQVLLVDDSHPFTVKQNNSTIYQITSAVSDSALSSDDGFASNFSYYIGNSSDTYTIDYYTKIINVDSASTDDDKGLDTLYINSDNVGFTNDTQLVRSGEATVDITGTKTYRSQVIAKSVAEGYNYSDHTVKWNIVVNRNKLPMTNANVYDEVPDGMTLLIDENHPFQVTESGSAAVTTSPSNGTSGSTSFVYNFEENIDNAYTITYYTHLEDEELLTQWTNKSFENEATLYADEITDGIGASASTQISNPIVTKEYTMDDNADYIEWSVIINPAKITLSGASVTDKLSDSLEFDASTLKLYEVEINADGTVSSSENGTLVETGYGVDVPSEDNDNTLVVTLPDNSSSVYRLEFSTNILTDDIDLVNSVSLSGNLGSPTGDADAERIVINDLWSKGGSGSYSLTVHKEDGNGNPVQGAEYQLLNRNYQPVTKDNTSITAFTDENGDAVFSNLPSWSLYVKEVEPPAGYLINPDSFGGNKLISNLTYNTSDQPAVGNVVFTKTSTKGTLISGGEFTLVGTDYANNMITRTAVSIKGTVTFENIPIGSYKITETKAPNGYYLTDEEITAEVVYNQDKTGVVVNVTPDTLENKAKPNDGGGSYGSIKLKKTDSTGKPLLGAEFGLYNTSGNLVRTAVSQANGIVEFKNVVYGRYTIREVAAPDGYRISDDELTALVSSSNQDVSANPYIVIDYKSDEVIPDKPVNNSVIRVKKIDSRTKTPLSGAEFALYDSNGVCVKTEFSDSYGIAIFTNIGAGVYTISETAAPKGYVLSGSVINVTVQDSNTYEFTVENRADDELVPTNPIPEDNNPSDSDTQTPESHEENPTAEQQTGADTDKSNETVNNIENSDILPQTGGLLDTSTISLFGISLIAVGFCTAYARWRKRRK